MAHVLLNPILKSISGRMGPVVFYHYNDRQYMRRYVVPRNPNTIEQTKRRKTFADAVNSWQTLAEYKKTQWNHRALALPMSGYNLYISKQMRNELPEEPAKETDFVASPSLLVRTHSVLGRECVGKSGFLPRTPPSPLFDKEGVIYRGQ